jgi:hypothetical protein
VEQHRQRCFETALFMLKNSNTTRLPGSSVLLERPGALHPAIVHNPTAEYAQWRDVPITVLGFFEILFCGWLGHYQTILGNSTRV